jgi:hypothetical protein
MQHGDKSFWKFLPPNKYSTKAIHPTVSAFNDPSTCLESGLFADSLGFLAASADMGSESELANNVTDLIKVIAFVQAQTLWFGPRGSWAFCHDAGERLLDQLHVMSVGAVNDHGQWNTGRFGQETALDALLSPICGIRTRFFEPANGAFVMAPSIDSHDQSIPFSPSYRVNPLRHRFSNTPASLHSRKRRYAELQEQIPVASRAFH